MWPWPQLVWKDVGISQWIIRVGWQNQNKMWLLAVTHLDGVTKAHYKEPGRVLKISILLQESDDNNISSLEKCQKTPNFEKGYLSHSGW